MRRKPEIAVRGSSLQEETEHEKQIVEKLCASGADDTIAVSALSELCALAKKTRSARRIDKLFSDRGQLCRFLFSSSPKCRKNAARLVGALKNPKDSDPLCNALLKEETLFVIPSMILAAGNLQTEKTKAVLNNYTVPISNAQSEDKHVSEIRVSLDKALGKFSEESIPFLKKTDRTIRYLVVPPEGFSDVLCEELEEKGFHADVRKDSCYVETEDPEKLYTVRCAREFLIPVGSGVPLEPEHIAECFREFLSFPYRLEIRNYSGDRTKLIRSIVSAAGGTNSPSRYAVELRIVCSSERADLFARLCNVTDNRFRYRTGTVPASMHPSLAACIVRYAAHFLHEGVSTPVVLDPCCGSGTLLFEREMYNSGGKFLGIDIDQDAVRIARNNAKSSGSRIRFIRKDMIRFRPEEKIDEMYANLPFGNRVGSHSKNKALYQGLISKLEEWLKPGGIAVLYTMESKLLTESLRKHSSIEILDKRNTEAGGLFPNVFFVRIPV